MPVILDTLLLVASLNSVPAKAVLPPPVLVPIASKSIPTPESLTTCYQNKSGSCWSED